MVYSNFGMPPTKTASVLIVSNCLVKSKAKDKYISQITKYLSSAKYNLTKISILPLNENILIPEIKLLSLQYDVLIVISELASGIIFKAIGQMFSQEICHNEVLRGLLEKQGLKYVSTEIETPLIFNFLEGANYPIPYVQQIFILHESYIDNQFSQALVKYLIDFNQEAVYEKVIKMCIKGKSFSTIHNVGDKVSFEVFRKSDSTVDLRLCSNKIEDMNHFVDQLKKEYAVIDSFAKIGSDLIYLNQSHCIKNALQTIELCLTQYNPENVFISFNGGKDCTVLLHLTLSVLEKCYPTRINNVLCLYVQSEKPFPDQDTFIEQCEHFYNLEIITIRSNIKVALNELLLARPNLKACLMGTRRSDPYSQDLNLFQLTDKDYAEIMRVSPLLDWHYYDIWNYILYHKISYCKLYDMGYTSLGNVDNTIQNPSLLYHDVLDQNNVHLPAYKLINEREERNGRGK